MTTISETAVFWRHDRDGDPYTDAFYEIDGEPAAARLTNHLMPSQVDNQLIALRQKAGRAEPHHDDDI